MRKTAANINTQTIWYLLGVFLPMATLFVRSPIYTRIYSAELYGKYTLVFVSYSFLASLFFQWISSSSWRYYQKYKSSNSYFLFKQIVLKLFAISILALLSITIIWYFIAKDEFQRKLILLGFLFCTSQELINTHLIPMRMREEARKYNIVNSLRAIASFGLLLILTFYFRFKIEAFFIAPIAINFLIIVYILTLKNNYKDLFQNSKAVNLKNHLKRFLNYGLTTLIFSTSLYLLATSDRYIIMFFNGYEKVGIYNQTYNLAQISITAILGAIGAALNPILLPSLEKKPNQSDTLLSQALYFAVYYSLIITVIFSLFSQQITNVLLGPDFREAYMIMPMIFFSSFLNGISHYASLKLKFKNMLRYIIIASVAATLINLLLNVWWIPIFGYKSAAYSTLISYLFLSIYIYKKSNFNPLSFKPTRVKFIIVISVSLLIVGLHFIIIALFKSISTTIIFSLIESMLLIGLYILLTYRISPIISKLELNNAQ